MIDLYSWTAPNGHKVQILLEEPAIPYRAIPINITSGAQHAASYRAINPNGKIPAIVNHDPQDGGAPRDVTKLMYLYMDCRRLAKLQGLKIRATTKLWDAALASQAMLFAKSRNHPGRRHTFAGSRA